MQFTFKTDETAKKTFEADTYVSARRMAIKHFGSKKVYQPRQRYYLVDINAKNL